MLTDQLDIPELATTFQVPANATLGQLAAGHFDYINPDLQRWQVGMITNRHERHQGKLVRLRDPLGHDDVVSELHIRTHLRPATLAELLCYFREVKEMPAQWEQVGALGTAHHLDDGFHDEPLFPAVRAGVRGNRHPCVDWMTKPRWPAGTHILAISP